MNTVTPIVVPISDEPDTCPQCGRAENKKEVCCHCGYEYKEEDTPWWVPFVAIGMLIGIVVLVVWFLFTMTEWIFGADATLWEILKSQWKSLSGLRIY